MRRKKASTRGVTRDPAAMRELVEACNAEMTTDAGGQAPDGSRRRAALVLCLRDRFSCTLEQIAEVVDLSAERVRQLYQEAKRAQARSARAARAPIEELSPCAQQGLTDAGLGPDASMNDVIALLPLLRMSAGAPHEDGVTNNFHVHQLDPEALQEIEGWLRRHGVPFR